MSTQEPRHGLHSVFVMTPRERQVLDLHREGKTLDEIGQALDILAKTARDRLRAAMEKERLERL